MCLGAKSKHHYSIKCRKKELNDTWGRVYLFYGGTENGKKRSAGESGDQSSFFDVDGTLLSIESNQVPDSAKEAVKKFLPGSLRQKRSHSS